MSLGKCIFIKPNPCRPFEVCVCVCVEERERVREREGEEYERMRVKKSKLLGFKNEPKVS